MSWFKRGSARQDGRASSSPEIPSNQNRRDTDPQTCLEVFRNHWQQALNVIENKKDANGGSMDDVNTVIHNFEHMVTLLVGEEGIDGMPGPILHYLLEKEIFETFCTWTIQTREGLSKLKYEQLRMFELAINQSKQLLLIHKAVIRPLMKLLTSCTDTAVCTEDIEYRTVLVLHQVCVCISQQTVILESFFNTNADHGPAKFLIFSLLISYIHREGPIGQNARDALLLIMALSVKYPHIGQYTADSDFCPVLATGLSGLYSSLPRKITPPSDDWFMLTENDIARNPDLQMFLNSLEFCNAVVQIGHPVVKNQLIKFIYDGFLVPVLGPALHQDIPGLPLPLLDTGMFANSREEVMTATAYLELFLRRITEPVLIRAFLKFILLEKNDEIVILDSLVTRINSNSRLSLVSLQLFKTLVSLNCEDVMLQLIFKYLIPCTHVMVSQRRSVKDLDLYSKSAEKFLSLRPVCCMPKTSDSPQSPHSNQHQTLPPTISPVYDSHTRTRPPPPTTPSTNTRQNKTFGDFFSRKSLRRKRSNSQLVTMVTTTPSPSETVGRKTPNSPENTEQKIEDYESSYFEYLHDARYRLTRCAKACQNWTAPYNGEFPPPDCFVEKSNENKGDNSSKVPTEAGDHEKDSEKTDKCAAVNGDLESKNNSDSPESPGKSNNNIVKDVPDKSKVKGHGTETNNGDKSLACNNSHNDIIASSPRLSKLISSLDSVSSFIRYLDDIDCPSNTTSSSIEDSFHSLESVLSNLSLSSSGDDASNSSSQSDSSSHHRLKQSGRSPGRSNIEVPSSLSLRDTSSYVEISMSSPPNKLSSQKGLLSQRSHLLSPDSTLSPSRWNDIELSFTSASSPSPGLASRAFALRYSNSPPNIGPFLSALFSKLESMLQNSLYTNLLLTDIMARLGAYPQPLLRSFLLNHNLVFQPTVKSLVQVLSSMRQKVDHYARTIPNFERLILRARKNLVSRIDTRNDAGSTPVLGLGQRPPVKPVRASTISEIPGKEKRSPSQSLRDLLFKRSPVGRGSKLHPGSKGTQLQRVPGGMGYLFINREHQEDGKNPEESLKTWNAVYCAIVLEEFLKELAALAQEHAVLAVDEGAIIKVES